MAFNKFMHPRNRYRHRKPDFEELARKYPEFERHIIRNQAGNATLDFRDAEALRALTCTLLKEDFSLDVRLPLDRLIPTLSLRLNYIHWIEDLLESVNNDGGTVYGIDIGCGASCIYPLLGAQMNKWNFLASEVDDLAIHYAKANVRQNELTDKITIIQTLESSMIEDLVKSVPNGTPIYHFTMCNPPFFGNALEAQGIMSSRSLSRPDPKSTSTAAELEMIADGGEVEFVRRMIAESMRLRNKIMWYTSMLGKKSSLGILKDLLRMCKIRNVTFTEFCQGRTMRWGIAWTFYENVEPPLPASKMRKLTDRRHPFVVPVPDSYTRSVLVAGQGGGLQIKIQAVAKALELMMLNLQMCVERIPSSKWCAKFKMTASRNTWSHQRRKRRKAKQNRAEITAPSSTGQSASLSSSSSRDDKEPVVRSASGGSAVVESSGVSDSSTAPPVIRASLQDCRTDIDSVVSSSDLASRQRSTPSTSSTSPADVAHQELEPLSHISAQEQSCHVSGATEDALCGSGATPDCLAGNADGNFPLEIQLQVKLGDKRAIVLEANVEENAKRHLLHEVVQYVKNQMK